MINNNKVYPSVLRASLAIVLSISASCFCAQIVPNTNIETFRIAIISTALLYGVLFFLKFNTLYTLARQKIAFVWLSLLAALILIYGSYWLTMHSNIDPLFPFSERLFYIASLPAATFTFFVLFRIIYSWTTDLATHLDEIDMRVFIIADLLFFGLAIILIISNSGWYTQYDDVYSLDSGWCFTSILPSRNYYDIRHPMLSIITYPIWAMFTGVAELVIPTQLQTTFYAIGIQGLIIQMLIASSVMLKVLTRNRNIAILYLCVFPTLLSAVALEKYVLSCFFVICTIYLLSTHERYAPIGYVLSMGIMPTSGFLLLAEFLKRDSLKTRIRRIGVTVVVGLIALICSGHCDLLSITELNNQLQATQVKFASAPTPLNDRVIACLNLFQGTFLPLASTTENGSYLWANLTSHAGVCALFIFVIVIIGMVVGYKNFIVRASTLWVFFAFLLFIPLNWAPYESVLFAPIFSWAIITLFVTGLDFILSLIKTNSSKPILFISIFCLIVGLMEIHSIHSFLLTNF